MRDVIDAFSPWRAIHRRDAWRPVVENRQGSPRDSKFGGMPYLLPNEKWPLCGGCRQPMQLFVQLDLSSLPETCAARSDDGILQLFYCTSSDWTSKICPAEDSAWQPFSKGKLVRVVQATTFVKANRAGGSTPFPEKVIVSWERFDDFPSPVEHDELGLKYDYDFRVGETFTTVEWTEQRLRFERVREPDGEPGIAVSIGRAAGNDKLGGWPNWIQGVEYPSCTQCSKRMEYVFQIDSEDHIPYMFGDVGCGLITRCREHPDVLGFGWACS